MQNNFYSRSSKLYFYVPNIQYLYTFFILSFSFLLIRRINKKYNLGQQTQTEKKVRGQKEEKLNQLVTKKTQKHSDDLGYNRRRLGKKEEKCTISQSKMNTVPRG